MPPIPSLSGAKSAMEGLESLKQFMVFKNLRISLEEFGVFHAEFLEHAQEARKPYLY
jgi:hypothetical protein